MKPIIPPEALTQHIAVLGKTGSGKSSALRLIAEGMLADKKPVCVIDPKGDWYGLKASADGKHAGFPVVIFGGEHADVPINAHSGANVAELFATGNRPCIIDLGGWHVSDRTRFFTDLAASLFKLSRGPRWLIIDEVHNFAPQGKIMDPQAGEMLHWANRLASEGRGKGITIFSASQRPQKVHKDFLTCAETLIAMRVIHNLDRNAIKEWVDGAGDPLKGREVLDTLASMPRGEGWVWSPEIQFGPVRIKFPMFSTYDSFKPQTSESTVKLAGWAQVDLEEVKSKMAVAIEKAKANDPAELRKRIAELEKAAKSTAPKTVETVKEKEIKVEVPVIKEADIKRLERAAEKYHAAAEKFHAVSVSIEGGAVTILGALKAYAGKMAEPARPTPRPAPTPFVRQERPRPVRDAVPREGSGELSKCGRSLLIAFAQHPNGLSKGQACTYAGYVPSGTTAGAFADFERNGWTSKQGDTYAVTKAGFDALGEFEPLPKGAELRDRMMRDGDKCESAILQTLFDAYPTALSKAEICEKSGYVPSGTTAGVFSKLSRLNWMERDGGGFKASDDLFQE